MNRLLERAPVSEKETVEKILARLHKAVDEAFPQASPAQDPQFSKTAFSEPAENTAIVQTQSKPTAPSPAIEEKTPPLIIKSSVAGTQEERRQPAPPSFQKPPKAPFFSIWRILILGIAAALAAYAFIYWRNQI